MTDSVLKNKSKPVDDVEDEEEDWEGDQEELVNPETKNKLKNYNKCENDIRDIGSTANLVLVFLVHLVPELYNITDIADISV